MPIGRPRFVCGIESAGVIVRRWENVFHEVGP
jgi:hypothetical protein